MINCDCITKENIEEHNPNGPRIIDHPCRILKTGVSGSGKTNIILILIKKQDDDNYTVIDKNDLYVKDPNEAKHQYLIIKLKKGGLKWLEDPKVFTKCSNNVQNVYRTLNITK